MGVLPLMLLAGCGGPSSQERDNRKAFESSLTAITLKNPKELDRDAQRIDERHASGALSDDRHGELRAIAEEVRSGEWGEAERRAYQFRESYPYFR